MRLPLEVVARNIDLSAPHHLEIEERVSKLDQFYDRIMRCRVTVEGPGRHHLQGSCTLRLNITVPGKEIVISRQSGEDFAEAIRETFAAAERRIEDHIRRSRRLVKTHEGPPRARVSNLFPEKGYGFLETPDGREIYFHRNSVVGAGFEHLKPGTPVRYSEEMGEKGPQASTVKILKRRPSTRQQARPSPAAIPAESPGAKGPSIFQRILVPLDGSLTSEAILPCVHRLFSDSEVILVRTPEGASSGPSATETVEEVRQYLLLVQKRLVQEGFKAVVRPAAGIPAEAILEAAREERPDLIAMTTHGRTGARGPLMGSVAEIVVRTSSVPVFAVRPFWLQESFPAPSPESRGPRTILVPLNGGDASLGILSHVLRLATHWGGRVILLQVDPDDGPTDTMPTRNRLAQIQDELDFVGIPVIALVDRGDPLTRILEAAKNHDVDLIAMATNVGPPESRFDDRSLTGRILRNARVPIFAVRAETEAPQPSAVPVPRELGAERREKETRPRPAPRARLGKPRPAVPSRTDSGRRRASGVARLSRDRSRATRRTLGTQRRAGHRKSARRKGSSPR